MAEDNAGKGASKQRVGFNYPSLPATIEDVLPYLEAHEREHRRFVDRVNEELQKLQGGS
jgi:hypothetical protein